MELMNKTEGTVILNRVEPTNDKESNKKLFELYANLINPMKSIENKMLECKNLRYQGGLVRKSKNDNEVGLIVLMVLVSIVFLSMFLIMPIMHVSWMKKLLIGSGSVFIILLFSYYHEKKKYKKRLLELEDKFNNLREEINNDIKILEPYLQYVPPAYRTSRALNYFVDSYINVRVENLSEAVKAYDNYVHQQKVQQEFRQVDARLKEISYMQSQSLSKMHVGINLGGMCLWL